MLSKIRGSSNSFWTYIVFGLIIVAFVFLGVGRFSSSSGGVAKVNGESISGQLFAQQAWRLYQQQMESNPAVAQDEDMKNKIKRYALDTMVFEVIQRQEAERLGLFVTPQELFQDVAGISLFQNEQGAFDANRYKEALATLGMNPAQFEKLQRESMLAGKLLAAISLSSESTEAEGKSYFEFLLQEREAEYVLFPKSDYVSKVTLTDEDLMKYYEGNQARFFESEKMNLEYITVTPQTLAGGFSVDASEKQSFYEENKHLFVVPEQYKVRHILLMAPPENTKDAKLVEEIENIKNAGKSIIEELKNGANFAKLAEKYSQDQTSATRGGEIGWQHKGAQITPAFEKAALELKPGELSDLVRTEYGYHILLLDDKKAASTAPLQDVEAGITIQLAEQKAKEAEEELRKVIINDLNEGVAFADIAKKFALQVQTTGHMTKPNLQNLLALQADALPILENIPVGEVAPAPVHVNNGVALVKVLASTPSRTLPFDDVKDVIKEVLTDEKASLLSNEAANKALAEFTGTSIPTAYKEKVQTTGSFSRSMPVVMPFGNLPIFTDVLNGMQPHIWAPQTFTTVEGAIIARVKNITFVPESIWEQQKNLLMPNLVEGRRTEVVDLYMERLISKAKITVDENIFNQITLN